MLKSVAKELPSNHYLKVKDSFIEVLLMKMYEHDFVEPQMQHRANKIRIIYDKLSRNDRIFLDLINRKAVKVDGQTNYFCH